MRNLLHIARKPNDRKLAMHEADYGCTCGDVLVGGGPGVSESPTTNIARGKSDSE
jgi:hypothetical protein